MESLDESVADPKKVSAVERVSIGKAESDRLASWLSQVQVATGGFLNLSKADLVNFLVRYHADELSAKEIQNSGKLTMIRLSIWAGSRRN